MKLAHEAACRSLAMLGLALSASSLCLLSCAGTRRSPLPSRAPIRPASAPDVDLWQDGAPTTKFGADIYRDVQCRTLDKIVSLEWRHATPELPSAVNVKDQNSEVFATRYWPTFVVPTDSYHLCVAGKTRDGEAVLERWTYGAQSAQGTPAPSCLPVVPTGGGTPHYSWTLPPRSQVEEVLRIPAGATHGMIRAIIPSLQSPTKAFVFLDGSRELWSVDLVAKTHDCAASPTATPGALVATGLTNTYQLYWGEDYTQKGHCYFFVATELPASGPMAATMVLIDSNRDGKLDAVRTISKEEWVQEGWGNPANLVQPHY